jgi:tyrosinase
MPERAAQINAQPRWRRRTRGTALLALATLLVALWIASSPVSQSSLAMAQDARHSQQHGAPRIRKNVKGLTKRERQEFVQAIHALKKVRSSYDPSLSYYDQFVLWHRDMFDCDPMTGGAMTMAHGGPMFLPWHREFMLLFENALRDVSHKDITVPYWDWTDPASTQAVFQGDFMGSDGDPNAGYAVTTGPFRKGKWQLTVNPVGIPFGPSASEAITRRFGSDPYAPALPSAADVRTALALSLYDVPPYDVSSDPAQSFRNYLEGWINVPGMVCVPQPDGSGHMVPQLGPASHPLLHNTVHSWVGGLLQMTPDGPVLGTMEIATSPNDPVFWLHHAQIDRLWAAWQQLHRTATYVPTSGYPGSNRDDMMMPFHTVGIMITPRDVEDIRALGYRYR